MRAFLWAYVKQHRRSIAAGIAWILIFAGTFALYHLPVEAVCYPALICAVLGLLWMMADIGRCYHRHQQMQRLMHGIAVTGDGLPTSDRIEVQDYQSLVRVLLDEQARREEKLSRRYSDMMEYYTLWAHQIKTPIASMKLQLQSMDGEQVRLLSSELNRIEHYVDMVLAYLRLDSDSTDYVFREVDLDKIICASIRRFSADFITRRLHVAYQNVSYRLITDEKWLSFVIEQILSNAIKYTLSGGVSIYMEEDTLCIQDTGIGIAPEDLPRIFQHGYTGLNGRGEQKASGLGLHLCRRVCQMLGYEISISSELDKGTCVKICFHKQNRIHE